MNGRRASRLLPTAGVALATPILAWFAIGDLSFSKTAGYHLVGPYQVGPESGYVVGGVAAAVAAAAMGVLVLRTRQGIVDRRSWAVVATLAGAGTLGALGWRSVTAGVVGANIGGGFAALVFPLLIAGLLVGAVWLAGGGGRQRLWRTWLLTLAAVLVAPALYTVLYVLGG